MLAKIRALLTTAVTWIIVAQGVLTGLSEQIAEQFPGSHTAENIAQAITIALPVLAACVLIVRRVVTVIPEQRQLEPLPAGTEVVPVADTFK